MESYISIFIGLVFFVIGAILSFIGKAPKKHKGRAVSSIIAGLLLAVSSSLLSSGILNLIDILTTVGKVPPSETMYSTSATEPSESYPVGSSITFGRYEQDNNLNNGSEPIEWVILENDGDRILVISRYALDCQRYNTTQTDVTWSTCTIRYWLNGIFCNAAFDSQEQEDIENAIVSANPNPKYDINPGAETTDKVFLLSLDDVEKYFSYDSERICNATPYAIAQGAFVRPETAGSWWLLRTPGNSTLNVASVNSDGSIDYDGGSVSSTRGVVRPAIWISIE